MYAIIYYFKETESLSSKEKDWDKMNHRGEVFRLRKNALHYVLDIVQQDYRNLGFATEPRVGGIYCYKSEKTAQGDRKITEIMIKVEKA